MDCPERKKLLPGTPWHSLAPPTPDLELLPEDHLQKVRGGGDEDQEQEVRDEEDGPAVLAHEVREAPEVADADGVAHQHDDRVQQAAVLRPLGGPGRLLVLGKGKGKVLRRSPNSSVTVIPTCPSQHPFRLAGSQTP